MSSLSWTVKLGLCEQDSTDRYVGTSITAFDICLLILIRDKRLRSLNLSLQPQRKARKRRVESSYCTTVVYVEYLEARRQAFSEERDKQVANLIMKLKETNMSSAFIFSTPFLRGASANKVLSQRILSRPVGRSTFIARKAIVPAFNRGKRCMIRMAGDNAPEQDQKPSAKDLAKLYGSSYIGTSIGLSIVSFASFYFMISVGLDVRSIVNAVGDWLGTTPIGRPAIINSISDTASTATLAYIAHKATSPFRFPLTVAATPVIAKAFSKKTSDEAGP